MKAIIKILIILTLINIVTSCSSMSGNVVPQTGPTMEEVYDNMHEESSVHEAIEAPQAINTHYTSDNGFHKLLNPELKMYVFPHLATKDEVPIPGYETRFSAYQREHYQPAY